MVSAANLEKPATREGLTQSMVDLVAGMVKALVDYPGEVTVQAQSENDGTALMLRVAQADLGKVIGKQGRTARSMRTILGAASMKAQHRFSLDIQQAGRPEGDGPARVAPKLWESVRNASRLYKFFLLQV